MTPPHSYRSWIRHSHTTLCNASSSQQAPDDISKSFSLHPSSLVSLKHLLSSKSYFPSYLHSYLPIFLPIFLGRFFLPSLLSTAVFIQTCLFCPSHHFYILSLSASGFLTLSNPEIYHDLLEWAPALSPWLSTVIRNPMAWAVQVWKVSLCLQAISRSFSLCKQTGLWSEFIHP